MVPQEYGVAAQDKVETTRPRLTRTLTLTPTLTLTVTLTVTVTVTLTLTLTLTRAIEHLRAADEVASAFADAVPILLRVAVLMRPVDPAQVVVEQACLMRRVHHRGL